MYCAATPAENSSAIKSPNCVRKDFVHLYDKTRGISNTKKSERTSARRLHWASVMPMNRKSISVHLGSFFSTNLIVSSHCISKCILGKKAAPTTKCRPRELHTERGKFMENSLSIPCAMAVFRVPDSHPGRGQRRCLLKTLYLLHFVVRCDRL